MYSKPAARAISPVPKDPNRNIRRMAADVHVDVEESNDVDTIYNKNMFVMDLVS